MRKLLWSFFEIFETLLIAVVAVFLIRTFVAQPFLVSGSSMKQSFNDGDYLLVDELVYRFREPERGEVVVFKNDASKGSYFIKRIVGMPGEHLTVDKGVVAVGLGDDDLQILNESYIINPRLTGNTDITLGDGEYFVMGDNRGFSLDSRSWGPLGEDDIVGLVRLRLWPFNKVMAIEAPVYWELGIKN